MKDLTQGSEIKTVLQFSGVIQYCRYDYRGKLFGKRMSGSSGIQFSDKFFIDFSFNGNFNWHKHFNITLFWRKKYGV